MSDPFASIKNAFSRYATGVTVVGCQPPGGPAQAITVNSFTSVSLDPTLVLWCLENRASVYGAFSEADAYGVSILGSEQAGLSNRYATPGLHEVPDDHAETYETGSPLLRGRLAGFDCRVIARHAAGDHLVLIGQVEHFDARDGEPLMYVGRQYVTGPKLIG